LEAAREDSGLHKAHNPSFGTAGALSLTATLHLRAPHGSASTTTLYHHTNLHKENPPPDSNYELPHRVY